MNSQNDLRQFHQFVGAQIDVGRTLSPEDALDEWRHLHPSEDDLGAIQEALDDLENGDTGIPLAQFDREFRDRHNLHSKS